MKLKVLIFTYHGESGCKVVRAYTEKCFDLAEKDLKMMSDIVFDKNWSLEECELFGFDEDSDISKIK